MYLSRVHYKDIDAVKILSKSLKEIIDKEKLNKRKTIFVCIGTVRYKFDALGPLVGEMVKHCNKKIKVYGLINDDIHAQNLDKKLKKIRLRHKNSNIIAIDASNGRETSIGDIFIKKESLKPGKGVGKNLQEVGDYCICANTCSNKNFEDNGIINDVDLDFIKDIAEVISLSILLAYK